MMKNPFLPLPLPEELAALEVHELVRDYPELLSIFRNSGIRVREAGTSFLPAGSFPGESGERVLLASLTWRGQVGV